MNSYRISTGIGDYDIYYENSEMSNSMTILKCRLIQILIENGYRDYNWRKGYFVFFFKSGGDAGWQFVVQKNGSRNYLEFHLGYYIKEFYRKNIEIFVEDDWFLTKPSKTICCKSCKGRKFMKENGFGFIEPCQSCNPDFFLPFSYLK